MYIAADIGGTRTRVAGSRDLDAFGAPVIFDTPQAYESVLKRLIDAVDSVKEEEPIEHVAIRPEA